LYGRAEHGGQIPSQFDLMRLSMLVRGHHDGIYEAAQASVASDLVSGS